MKVTNFFTIFFLISLCRFSCSMYDDHFSASGYVVDSDNDRAIEGARISLAVNDNVSVAESDKNGYFEISISIYPDSATAAVLHIAKEGYQPYSKVYNALITFELDTFFLKKIDQ